MGAQLNAFSSHVVVFLWRRYRSLTLTISRREESVFDSTLRPRFGARAESDAGKRSCPSRVHGGTQVPMWVGRSLSLSALTVFSSVSR